MRPNNTIIISQFNQNKMRHIAAIRFLQVGLSLRKHPVQVKQPQTDLLEAVRGCSLREHAQQTSTSSQRVLKTLICGGQEAISLRERADGG